MIEMKMNLAKRSTAILSVFCAVSLAAPAVAKTPTYKMGSGTATVISVNKAAGKIKLNHGPIPALKWPGMKMGFVAKPEVLGTIAPGDKVMIDIRSGGGKYEITKIVKQ
jgi:Cu(I)/Ag(I) efflux system periplasmic protein CusF